MGNREQKSVGNMVNSTRLFCGCQSLTSIGECSAKYSTNSKANTTKDLDAAEFERIAELGEKENLKLLLESVGERFPGDNRQYDSVFVPETWELIVECKDETEQQRFFEKLKSEGYKLRILTL